MARSLSNVKKVATLISNQISATTNRRGFAAVSQGVEASRRNMMAQKPAEKEPAWIPDPLTGYYRPENVANEQIDVAELREMLVKQSKSEKK